MKKRWHSTRGGYYYNYKSEHKSEYTIYTKQSSKQTALYVMLPLPFQSCTNHPSPCVCDTWLGEVLGNAIELYVSLMSLQLYTYILT
jgi:hypothetical protein